MQKATDIIEPTSTKTAASTAAEQHEEKKQPSTKALPSTSVASFGPSTSSSPSNAQAPCWDPNTSGSTSDAKGDKDTTKVANEHQDDGNSQHDRPTSSDDSSSGSNSNSGGNGSAPVSADPVDSFDDMNLRMELLRGVYAYGFEDPTAIQQRAVVPISLGRDAVVQAPSGMGKTATFSIGALQRVDVALDECQVLALSPTRELAVQTGKTMTALGTYLGVGVVTLIGGQSTHSNRDRLRGDGVHVVCGTPGRVLHMLNEGTLDPRHTKVLILDEADVMLDGFVEEVHDVVVQLPKDTQVILVTATTTDPLMEISKKILRDPVSILVKPADLKLEGIQHFFVDCVSEAYKYATLCDLYKSLCTAQTVVFVNRRRAALRLDEQLRADKFAVSVIHGEMEQEERLATMDHFCSGQSRVLIATNVVARGIDVQQVSLVINYDVPLDRESYIHRAGRGGRQGRKGVTINLVTEGDARFLNDIEQFYNIAINPLPADLTSLQI